MIQWCDEIIVHTDLPSVLMLIFADEMFYCKLCFSHNWCLCRFISKPYSLCLTCSDLFVWNMHYFASTFVRPDWMIMKYSPGKTIVWQTYILIPLIYSCHCYRRCFKYAWTWTNASFQRNPQINTYTLTRVWRYKKWLEIDRFPNSR